MGDPPGEPSEPKDLQGRLGHGPRLGGRAAEVQGTKSDVLKDRGAEELIVGVLEQEPNPPTHIPEVRLGAALPTEGQDLAPTGPMQAQEQMQQGALTRPVRAHQGDAFPGPNR